MTLCPLSPVLSISRLQNPVLYLSHQDGGDDVRSVLEAVGIVAAPYKVCRVHVFLVLVPVAHL